MTATLSPVSTIVLTLLVASGYAVATIGMKLCAEQQLRAGIMLLVLGLACVILCEVILLRFTALSVLYLAIVGAETLIVLAYAVWMGEGFGLKQATGAALVLAGLCVTTT
ncbi:hypothetical protein [Roseivivax isoporae]|uniref:5-aminolevulinate synthase n=1 Tax=Roseivivax isoporae LMG 25204 TaxID=1449351 RepID=X7FAL7_9RHOB|nr:hypothetical protein [Roseivivax isoporae]ETX29109.1 5-aminolevulinate synthase [Roseivivax isoporae LMG 25204]